MPPLTVLAILENWYDNGSATAYQGMDVLLGAMGLIDAERFVAAMNREQCDYTKWRAGGLPALGIDGIAELANRLSDTLDGQ